MDHEREQADQQDPAETGDPGATSYVPVRRRPELMSFLWVGGILGLVVGGVVGLLGPDATNSSTLQEVVLVGGIGLLFGGFLGAIGYLVADRRSLRR